MAQANQASGSVEKVKKALAPGAESRPGPGGGETTESFRSARSALGQITTDLERLRRHAATLVKGAHRPAK